MGKKKKPEPEYEEDEPDTSDEEQGLIPIEDEQDLVRYLDEHTQGDPAITLLVPPDLTRCQCEWRDTTTDLSFGPKPMVRCDQEPTVIAFQKRDSSDDQPTGAISLCDEHKALVDHMYPDQCYFRRITTDKKIGDFA